MSREAARAGFRRPRAAIHPRMGSRGGHRPHRKGVRKADTLSGLMMENREGMIEESLLLHLFKPKDLSRQTSVWGRGSHCNRRLRENVFD